MSDDDLIVVRDFLLKRMPWDLSRPRFMDFQRQQISEKMGADPMFASRLRRVALEALQRDNPEVICRGLIALAFVGVRDDLPMVEAFGTYRHPKISKFAKTSLSEISRRYRAA